MLLYHDRVAIGHAILGCLATLGTIPAALLIGRYCRSNPKWILWHIGLNAATTLLIILTFATGTVSVASADLGTQFNGPNSDFHHKLGLGVLCIVLVETLLGVLARTTKAGLKLTQGGKRPLARWVHMMFGILTAGSCYWICWEGMHNEWAEMSTSMTVTPQGVQILFWVFFLFEVAAYTLAVGTDVLRVLEAWNIGYEPVQEEEVFDGKGFEGELISDEGKRRPNVVVV